MRRRVVEAGPKEMGTSRVRSLPGSEFFTRKVSRRLTIFVCTYLLKQVLQTGSVRTEIATGSVWQRLQRLGVVVVVVVVVGSAGGGGGEAVRDGISIFLFCFPVEMLGRLLFPCEVGRA
jgi:hypothetical protein